MFKKAAIALFFVSIISNFVYTMKKIPSDEYVSLVQEGNKDIFPDALVYANNQAIFIKNKYDIYQHEAVKKSSKTYVALINQNYEEAFEPGKSFAEALYAYKGTYDIDIPALNESNLPFLLEATKIYVALLENNKNKIEACYKKALDCANFISEITQQNLCHFWHNVYDTLNEQAAKIYTHLIANGCEKAYENGEVFADNLSDDKKNYFSKISAARVYSALILAKSNFDIVCEKAAKLAQTQCNTSEEVVLITYAGLVNGHYGLIYDDALKFIIKKEYPGLNYNSSTTTLIFKLCVALVLSEVSHAGDYLKDYAQRLITACEQKDSLYRFLLSNAMPLLEALNKKGLLLDDDLKKAKEWAFY